MLIPNAKKILELLDKIKGFKQKASAAEKEKEETESAEKKISDNCEEPENNVRNSIFFQLFFHFSFFFS